LSGYKVINSLLTLAALVCIASTAIHAAELRSSKARSEFKRTNTCPSTSKTSGACPGYIVDHIQALKHGGADDPSNMQWQTVEAAKAKDKWE
jgi:hypothetical protein